MNSTKTPSRLARARMLLAFAALLFADTASADLLPSSALRRVNALADQLSDSLVDTSLGPVDESFNLSTSQPGLICPILTWTADADQTSSFTVGGIDAVGSVSISIPPEGCTTGNGASARSVVSMTFVTEEPREFVLTGTASNAVVRLRDSGSGPVYFERLATDPGGPFTFSATLPADGYTLIADADVVDRPQFSLETPYSMADFDVQLVTTPVAASVPVLGPVALLFLGTALGTVGVLRARRTD